MECEICQETLMKGIVRLSCDHAYCKKCFIEYFDSNFDYPLKCLLETCNKEISYTECSKLFCGEDLKRLNQRRKIWMDLFDKFLYKCQSPKCDGEIRHFEVEKLRRFECPKCKLVTCLRCKHTHLKEESCKKWRKNNRDIIEGNVRRMREVERKIKERTAMFCVKCGLLVERDGGCYGIKCSMCKTELCLITQKSRWGPQGRGDLSGGCGCIFGYPCHPKCNSCNVDDPMTMAMDYNECLSFFVIMQDFANMMSSFPQLSIEDLPYL